MCMPLSFVALFLCCKASDLARLPYDHPHFPNHFMITFTPQATLDASWRWESEPKANVSLLGKVRLSKVFLREELYLIMGM
jgi:hypothetical protein